MCVAPVEYWTMKELARPFVRLWEWVEVTGGYPGQLLFCLLVIMAFLGFFFWFGNKRS
jgi:hypothetical protein